MRQRELILTKTFREIDTDKSGFIDAFEVEEVFKKYYSEKNKAVGYEELKNKVLVCALFISQYPLCFCRETYHQVVFWLLN